MGDWTLATHERDLRTFGAYIFDTATPWNHIQPPITRKQHQENRINEIMEQNQSHENLFAQVVLESSATSDAVRTVHGRSASLLRQLTIDERAIVHFALYGNGPLDAILVQIGTDSVQRSSMQRLRPGKFVNDEIIHYFLIMLANRDDDLCRLHPGRIPSHFFKSYFMTMLLNDGNDDENLRGIYNYSNVSCWSNSVKEQDIFSMSKLFFIINQDHNHWVCIVAFMEEKRIQLYDSNNRLGKVKSKDLQYLNYILRYIKDEHLDKKGFPFPGSEEWQLIGSTINTPNQRNGMCSNTIPTTRSALPFKLCLVC
jgi:sentrin-specific protease 1